MKPPGRVFGQLRFVGSLGLALVVTLVSSAASAQEEPNASEVAVARTEFRRGMDAAAEARWEDARRAFARAYQLVGRPRILLNLAGAQVETGRLVRGAESYRRFLREATDPRDVPLRDAAEQALRELEPRIPHLRLEIDGILPGDALTIDEHPLSSAVLGAPLPLDPGPHEVVVRRAGDDVLRHTIELEERQNQELSLRIEAPAAVAGAQVPPPAETAARAAPRTDDAARSGTLGETEPSDARSGDDVVSSPWLWIAIGLAVAGAAVGLTFFGLEQTGEAPFSGNLGPGSHVVR